MRNARIIWTEIASVVWSLGDRENRTVGYGVVSQVPACRIVHC